MHATTPWHLALFGGLRAARGPETITRFRSQKIGALLAYLALYPQRVHSREELADLFWPDADPEAGRTNLRTALSSLRRQLEPPGTAPGSVVVTRGHRDVLLEPAAVTTDVAQFERALKSASRPDVPPGEKARLLGEAIALYAGPLLPGFYETWALTERDRLAEAHLGALRDLAVLHEAAGETVAALESARRAVSADPLSEEAHARVIRLLMATGQAAAAKRQFDELARLLDDKLGEEPSPETRALLTRTPSAGHAAPGALSRGGASPGSSAVVAAAPPPPAAGVAAFATAPATPRSEAPPEIAAPLRLPLTLTRFFGRDEDLAQLAAALTEQGDRLVTLTGPGGSGKTRLAIETARRAAVRFPGGVHFVPLADLREPERLPNAVADALGIPRATNLTPLDQVVGALATAAGPALLVLDNLEHLVDAGGQVVHSLLVHVPSLSVLVTSRQRLLLDGEREFALLPLPTPPHPGTPERLLEFASVQLFVNRAQSARPDFQLSPRNADAVAALCARLEGIPLAIELAAAWSQTLTPNQMLERLADRFDLLVTRRRDAPGRHATLRATIEWSWELLPPELRRFFAQLAVFRGGWSLEAAEAVTGEPRALEFLAELRERSLVIATEEDGASEGGAGTVQDDEPAAMRFRMLETVREFAAERVGDDIDRGLVAERHFDYFGRFAAEAVPHLRSRQQIAWLHRLERDHDNLRAALTLALQEGVPAGAALRFAGSLVWFWLMRGHLREGVEWVRRALAVSPLEDIPVDARASALPAAGWLAWRVYDAESRSAAVAWSDAGLTACQERGERWGMAFSLATLGLAAHHANEPPRARILVEKAVAAARSLGDPWLLGHCLCTLGKVLLPQGQLEGARVALQEGLAAFRVHNDRYSIADTLRELGILLATHEDRAPAKRLIEESIALFKQLGDIGAVGLATTVLAYIAGDEGDYPAARAHFETSLRLCREAGNRYGTAHSLLNRAYTFIADRDFNAARADFTESLSLFRDLRNHSDIALAFEGFARLAHARQEWERSVRLFAVANAMRVAISNPMSALDADRRDDDLGEARDALGDDRYWSAWSAGLALDPEQAAEYALGS
jgi:predicted ATPase/DNA-binding SARP family transcriptional activator